MTLNIFFFEKGSPSVDLSLRSSPFLIPRWVDVLKCTCKQVAQSLAASTLQVRWKLCFGEIRLGRRKGERRGT